MVLKGPELQERLYGTPAAYESSDIDVLVRRRDARTAREVMLGNGWTFEPENGVLWRLSAAASFEREGSEPISTGVCTRRISLRGRCGRSSAHCGNGRARACLGFCYPTLSRCSSSSPYTSWVTVRAARVDRERSCRRRRVVRDWSRVWSIAPGCACHAEAVREAMSEQTRCACPRGSLTAGGARGLVDDVRRVVTSIPQDAAGPGPRGVALRREGFGLTRARRGGRRPGRRGELVVDPGVFEPQSSHASRGRSR